MDQRVGQLVDRLLVTAERAASQGAWDHVEEILQDVLAVAPDHRRAAELVDRARLSQAFSGGERVLVSLLFSDIARSTDMAENAEPEFIRDLFRIYRAIASDAIEALEGKVLQFQGDGIVACFGHPKAHGDDAQRAVLAGLEIVERMAKMGPRIHERLGLEAPVRVGVHSGTVVAGFDVGPGGQPDVVGAATNMAARLQAVAEPGTVVISDATRPLVEPSFELTSVGKRALKGIAEPVEVFRVGRVRPAEARLEAVKLHSAAVIGRDAAQRNLRWLWDSLRSAWERSEAPERPLVVLRGPAGIGKTRLAADLCAHVERQGVFAAAACSPFHTNVPMWPIARMAERQLGMHAAQPPEERIGILKRRAVEVGFDSPTGLPLVASMLGLGSPDEHLISHLSPAARRAEMLSVCARWVSMRGAQRSMLLFIDDLQWADPTTMDWLRLLVEGPVPGLLLLVGSREPVPPEWAERAVDIELKPLDGQSALALVAEIAEGAALTVAKQRQIVERSGGIPLFIEELARSMATARQEGRLPLRLRELLAARLQAPGLDLRLVQLAATFGPVFDQVLLAELAGTPIDPALMRLEAAGIVEPLGGAPRRTYRFSHVLLRDAAYETQVLEVRRETHRRVARVLRAAPEGSPGDAAVIAQHLELAGDVYEATAVYMEAAQEGQACAHNVEARRLFTRALELLRTTPEGEARDLRELLVRLLRGSSICSVLGYAHPDALEDFQAADDLCRRYKERPEAMPAAMGVWLYFFTRSEHATSRAAIERLSELVAAPQGAWFAPEVRSGLGFQELFAGQVQKAGKVLEEAWEGYLQRPRDAMVSALWALPQDPAVATAFCLACVAGLQGRMAESEAWCLRASERAAAVGPPRGPFSVSLGNVLLAWLRMSLGDPVGAYRHGRQAMEIAEEYGYDYFVALGRPFILLSEPGVVSDPTLIDQVEPAMDAVGHRTFRPACLANIARARALLGEAGQALEKVGDAFRLMRESGEWIHQQDLLRLRAELTAVVHPDRMEAVVRDLRAAIDVGLTEGSLALALLAANDLARLPVESRPPDWRSVLRSVYDLMPPDAAFPGLAEARALLEA